MSQVFNSSQGASVVFSNYNYAFMYFNRMYIALCSKLSITMSLRKVRTNVSTFLYEFSYAIPSQENWLKYKRELEAINREVNEDTEFAKVMEKDDLSFRDEVSFYPAYYSHLIKYLDLMGRYVADLSSTYLPRTQYQRTLLSFKNDSPFYEKLHEYKQEVYEKISDFTLFEFKNRFNSFLIFFYAYSLFINEKYSKQILKVSSVVLSIFTNRDVIDILAKYPNYTKEDLKYIYTIESTLHNSILFCNSLINTSLSSYGVLPKLRKKVYDDRTLI